MKGVLTLLLCPVILAVISGCNSDRDAIARAYNEAIGPKATARKMQELDGRVQGKSSTFVERFWSGERLLAERMLSEARRGHNTWATQQARREKFAVDERKRQEERQKQQGEFRKIANHNGRIVSKDVYRLFREKPSRFASRYQNTGAGFTTSYPFLLFGANGTELGIAEFVPDYGARRKDKFIGVEVTLNAPAPNQEAMITAVGQNPNLGQWEYLRSPKAVEQDFYPAGWQERICIRLDRKWLVVGLSRP